METLQKCYDYKKELDDSGCVQDGPLPKQLDGEDNEAKEAQLLDLSDDVLLMILKYCSPRDLKALGYSCQRLGRLIRDRTLWQRVDARGEPTGRARLRWLLAHALGSNTTELLLTGYAREARGCLGHVDKKRKEIEEELAVLKKKADEIDPQATTSSASEPGQSAASSSSDSPVQLSRATADQFQRMYAQQCPRYSGVLSWPEDDSSEVDPEDVVLLDGSCSGPQFTLTQCMLRQLRTQCSLTSLALQYCNINCSTTGINHFPPTLKKLSLRGSKCYNLPLDKSFLFNIQDYLPQLEFLDLSECEWLEPASFLPLSKVSNLTHLIIRDCHRMTEFVAYASLATRYGFRKLKYVDARGSPLGDSEVSALGWLPSLEELQLSPARAPPPRPPDHSHCRDERLPPHKDLQPWELQEPEYFKIKPQIVEPMDTRSTTSIEDIEEHIEQLRNYENNICLHGLEYNLCMKGIRRGSRNCSDKSEETKETSTPVNNDFKLEFSNFEQPSTSSRNCSSPNEPGTVHFSVKNPTNNFNKINDFRNNTNFKDKPNTSTRNDTEPSTSKSENAPQPSTSFVVQPGTSLKRTTNNSEVIPSKKSKINDNPLNFVFKSDGNDDDTKKNGSKKEEIKEDKESNECYSSDDDIPLKRMCKNAVNEGASTSQDEAKSENNDKSKKKKYDMIRFRRNMDPVIVRRDADEVEEEERQRERERENREREMRERNGNQNIEARPRAHVLYVNVGQQLHTVYRLSIHNEPPIFYSFSRNSHLRFRPNVGTVFYTPPTLRLDSTSLVTDSAVRRFGRADTDDVNVVFIGLSRPGGDPGARPNRSSLRVLSITGFRKITDRSLEHLATAAPHLRYIDFSESGVTAQGVENFKSLRPDCEVIFSEYVEKDEAA